MLTEGIKMIITKLNGQRAPEKDTENTVFILQKLNIS